MKSTLFFLFTLCLSASYAFGEDHLFFKAEGESLGKHVVLIAGDEEYRSEEAMPMLGQLLARAGFDATVLFSLDEEGNVNANKGGNLSHSVALEKADAIVISLRFRHWDDESMQRFDDALNRGVPIVALRTSTHAFKFDGKSKWAKYSFNAKPETGWAKGFGRAVLGETWVNHHGRHKVEGCRTHVAEGKESHPILNGVGEIFAESDVYGADPLQPSDILLFGEVTETLEPDSKGVAGKNDPMQPVVWTREFKNEKGGTNRIVTSTMGASSDLDDENLRRLVVNGVFWSLGLDVPEKADVEVEGYEPTFYSFGGFKANLKPKDFIPGAAAFKDAKTFKELENEAKKKKKAEPKKEDKKKAAAAPVEEVKKKLPRGVLAPLNPKSVAFEKAAAPDKLKVSKGDRIVIMGAGMGSRMVHFNQFETEVYLRFADQNLIIRNIADEGNTPAFRPHPGRDQSGQYAFPGAKELLPENLQVPSNPIGHFETPDQWLTRLGADTIIAFFGFNSSFGGPDDVDRFKKELAAYIQHTLSQHYNGESTPQLAVVSPTAYQDLSEYFSGPDAEQGNKNIALYTEAMKAVCAENGALFVDAYAPSLEWFQNAKRPYTVDGALLNNSGYRQLAPVLADALFGKVPPAKISRRKVLAAVAEKNWAWLNDFKVPNGVHVYGRRYEPYGPDNYPFEIKKTREFTEIRDLNIWATLRGEWFNIAAADAKTSVLPPVKTNYNTDNKKNGRVDYNPGRITESLQDVADGFKMELFASNEYFPDLKNPVQLAFDNKGRLWVATMESYPHYRIGDPKPKDKLLILEDTNKDGFADKQTVFADDLHIPIGFEISHDGVYVSQSGSLVLLKDLDGDDAYDTKEVLLSGFDDHDTHHAISAFCADPSGALIMGEGIFLHSNVESAYGTARGTNGGFYRYNPQRRKIERYAQFKIPNPWGVAVDQYGQDFFLHTSGTSFSWMLPGTVRPRYGANLAAPDLLQDQKVRPTSGVEFVSSRHFPEEFQGDVLINNNIGYLGIKQHKMIEDGTGFTTEYRQDLFKSNDLNLRPTDLEFAPDGSLYVVDWHNALIGHMQHNARDPNRDHVHGRIFRITYPSRSLVKPPKIDGASVAELLENLKLPEYRARYRTRRELRKNDDGASVAAAASNWASNQDDDRLKLEALWVTWGADHVDQSLLEELMGSDDHRVRAAAVRVARFNDHKIDKLASLLEKAAGDEHGRVRLEAVAAATYLEPEQGEKVLSIAEEKGTDSYNEQSYSFAERIIKGEPVQPAYVQKSKKAKVPSGIISDTSKKTVIQINCVVEALKFDQKTIKVEVGKQIELILNNPDDLQHNLLVVQPGTDGAIANAAIELGASGLGKHYVPESKDIIAATKLLNKKQKQTIKFKLDKPGKYPFICTFPGHAFMMRGELIAEEKK